MRLYNTLSRSVEPFAPARDDTVRFYVCGPTVYDHLHIGNLRPAIVFDAMRRYMEQFKGWRVVYVQNVTDVDDKLIDRSRSSGEPVEAIAERYTEAFFSLLRRLEIQEPTHSPRATEHIDDMIALLEKLVALGAAYESGGDVYFRVSSSPGYGELSGRRLEEQEVGSRVEASEKKEHPLDFTLWKAAKPGEPHWPSPWGEGRPGWHTECVVLSHAYLGDALDIHAGGNDLVFPHHENERAQAEAAYGAPFARFWLHNGMLHFGGEEMHKSTGNFVYAHTLLERHAPGVIRFFYLSRHYRKPLEYSEGGLDDAAAALRRVRTCVADLEASLRGAEADASRSEGEASLDEELERLRVRYVEALDDDFNTVEAIAVIQEIVSVANRFRAEAGARGAPGLQRALSLLRELDAPLGLLSSADGPENGAGIEEGLVDLVLELRETLREMKAFERADAVRQRLAELGILVKDTSEGTLWTRGDRPA